MSDTQILLFLFSSVAVILTPGQDFVLVISRGMTQGVKAGIVSAAGVSIGLIGHTLLAALGLGTLLMNSALLFTLVKLVGAAYLIYLGVGLLRGARRGIELEHAGDPGLWPAFRAGAISNIANPKITIFYLAFLPQFVTPETSDPTALLLALGLAFAALTFLIKLPFGYFAGRASNWLRQRPQAVTWMDRVSGSIMIALGLRLALQRSGTD